jgi:ribonucleoside-triphosphate reductase
MNTINNIEQAYQELLEKEERRSKTFESIVNLEANDVTKENANVSAETINGQLFRMWSETSKEYAIDHLLSPEVLKYKNDNILYIHDLDFLFLKTLTCLQTPLDKIFKDGFVL